MMKNYFNRYRLYHYWSNRISQTYEKAVQTAEKGDKENVIKTKH